MLEVLYKILSCIITAHLSRILSTIKRLLQRGFIAQHNIKDPSPSCDTSHTGCRSLQEAYSASQLVSFNMEKAFNRVGHHIIRQALLAFGVQELMKSYIITHWSALQIWKSMAAQAF
jgi:hypothetical protein